MSALGRFSGRAAGAAAAAVAAGSSSTVQARAPPAAATAAPNHAPPGKSLGLDEGEEWLLTDCTAKGDVVLFKPFQAYEVEGAVAEVAEVFKHPGVTRQTGRHLSGGVRICEEGSDASATAAIALQSGSSTPSSEGSQANAVISSAGAADLDTTGVPGRRTAAGRGPHGGSLGTSIDMQSLLDLTTKMLRRPGMQSELVKALMEDQDIQDILVRECGDLDNYLLAAGATQVHSLLPPAAAAAAAADADGNRSAMQDGDHKDLVSSLVETMLSALGQAGNQMQRLVCWLRRLPILGLAAPGPAQESEGGGDQGDESGASTRTGKLLKDVLSVAVIVVVLMVFRRPFPSFMRFRAF